MTATLERDAEMVDAEVVYTMPKPRLFQMLGWYDNADRNCAPQLCYVNKVNHNSVEVVFLSGNRPWWLMTMTHITDPRLQQQPNRKVTEGAWDFLPEDSDPRQYIDNQLKAVWKRIDAMELNLKKLTK